MGTSAKMIDDYGGHIMPAKNASGQAVYAPEKTTAGAAMRPYNLVVD